MKHFLTFLLIAALGVVSASAQSTRKAFAGTSTALGNTNDYFVIPAFGSGVPVVNYVNFSSDKAGSVLTFRVASTTNGQVTAVNAGTSTIVSNFVGTAFAAADVVLLRYAADEAYEQHIVAASTSTNMTLNNATGRAVTTGDTFYKMRTVQTIPVGITTNSIVGACYYGAQNVPSSVSLDNTTTGAINAIAGEYK